MGSLGGNLLQATRCWYWRLGYNCRLHGGDRCHAREGEHREHAIFANDFCASAHPSDPAAALLALGATIRTDRRELPLAELYRQTGKPGKMVAVVFEATITSQVPPASYTVSESGHILKNAEVSKRFAKQVKQVIVEKPMSVTVDDCQEMIDECKKAGVQLAVQVRLIGWTIRPVAQYPQTLVLFFVLVPAAILLGGLWRWSERRPPASAGSRPRPERMRTAPAWMLMPTPSGLSSLTASKTSTSKPARRRHIAAVRPPMPAPAMTIFIAL
jgi:hypothetical protein